ncbi:uncharacterized protein LOC142336282 [Convolutriloba macropyga]|uniref:uncharacterized protein LOC142336282 n=1 Tax=Convolutriloba macropyga TaxID=536237 RepID=UPI003F52558E
MADTSSSLTSDDSGGQDSYEMSEKLPTCLDAIEMEDSVDIRDFCSEIQTVISQYQIDQDATEWIINNFHEWKTINALDASEDLSVKKIRLLQSALSDIFDRFVINRQKFINHLLSAGVEIEIIWSSPLIKKFARGTEVVAEFLRSEELEQYFSASHVTIMRATLLKNEQSSSTSNETCRFERIRAILNECNLHEEAVVEVLSKIVAFDDLKACLDDCEELTKKQTKLLLEKLGDIFQEMLEADLKVDSEDFGHLFQDLKLPVEAVDWINQWLKAAQDSDVDLSELDKCEDLNKKQLKAVKEKLAVFFQKKSKIANPRESFLHHVRAFLNKCDDLSESIKLWVINNITDFGTLDELEKNEELTKRQIRGLKTALADVFTVYVTEMASSQSKGSDRFSGLFQDLDLPEVAIDWITQWLESCSTDSNLDLSYLDQCEDLNKRQLILLKDKLTAFLHEERTKMRETEEIVDPLRLLQDEVACQLRNHSDIADSIKQWIVNNIQTFETLDDLGSHEELTKRQIRELTADLSDAFEKYREDLSAIGQTTKSRTTYSDLLHDLDLPQRAVDWIDQWINSTSIDSNFDLNYLDNCEDLNKKQLKCVKEKLTGLLQLQENKNCGENMDPQSLFLQEIALRLKQYSGLNESVEQWILGNILTFKSLDDLNANEELNKRQIRELGGLLLELFQEYQKRTVSENESTTQQFSFMFEGLDLSEKAVNWLNDWLESCKSSCIHLECIDECEELNKRQQNIVKEKLKVFLQFIEPQKNLDTDPEAIFRQNVQSFLSDQNELDESVKQWILSNIASFKSLDELEYNEELNKRQIRELKSGLQSLFDLYREQETSSSEEQSSEVMKQDRTSNSEHGQVGVKDKDDLQNCNLEVNDISITPFILFDGLGFSEKAIDWLNDWFKSCHSSKFDLNCVDECEELNKRQQVIVKNKLREFLQSDGADQNTDTNPQAVFIQNVETFLKDQNELDHSMKEWIVSNIASFKSLDELESNEELNKRQIRELKMGLEKKFEIFCQQKSSSGQQKSEVPNEIEDGFQNHSAQIVSVEPNRAGEICELDKSGPEYDVSITPLILFHTELQDGFAVEKFALSEEGVKYICASVPQEPTDENPVLYYTGSGVPIINFNALDQLKIECIGLFGPIKAVLQNLRRIVSESKMCDVEQFMAAQQTGLYMLNLSDYKKYLIFYCEKDIDFKTVKKDSKAVHFLRYMSQLCNNVIMCLDGNYEDRLATNEEKLAVKCDRRIKYDLTKHEVQQESFSLLGLGVKNAHYEDFFSSENSLVAVKYEKVRSFVKRDEARRTGDVREIKKIFDVMAVENTDSITHEFKKEYLKTFEAEAWSQMMDQLNQELHEKLEVCEKEVQETIAMSIVVHFCKGPDTKLPMKVLASFFNKSISHASNLWIKLVKCSSYREHGKILISDVVKIEDQFKIKDKLSSKTEESKVIEKYFLWRALSEIEDGLSEDLVSKGFEEASWEDVKGCAEKAFPAGIFAGTQSKIMKAMEAAGEKEDYSNATTELQTCVQIYLSYLWEITELFKNKSVFVTFCRSYAKSALDKEKDGKASVYVQQNFEAVMQRLMGESSEKQGLVKSVKVTRYGRAGKNFDCIYEKSSTEPAKTKIEINTIALSRIERQRPSTSDQKMNIKELQFYRAAVLEISELETLVSLVPLDKFVLLILNVEHRYARTVVYSLANVSTPCLNICFGRTVASSSFDSKARLLAIQSKREPGVIHLIKFGEDYKSRQNLKSVDLSKMFPIENCVKFCLQPNSKFLWFLHESRVRKIDYKNGSMINTIIKLEDMCDVDLRCIPDGGCLLAIDGEKGALPIMTETGNLLKKVDRISSGFQMFHIFNEMIGTQIHNAVLSVYQIVVTGAQYETQLNKNGEVQHDQSRPDDCGKELKEQHWIDYVYWMYTKFPCDDLLMPNQRILHFWFTALVAEDNLKEKLTSAVASIWNRISMTKKPMNFLKIHVSDLASTAPSKDDEFCLDLCSLSSFLVKLITFIPVQIARCQSNTFYVLENGMPISLDAVQFAFDLSAKINLRFYESIFSAWNGKIKVISSMGKQTTGKSFTLNHLTGSSFNISGGRCTDGCWMTVKEQDDCLYVILDFEGLGSIERTEQDDMLLSLFNSSISTLTIFKTEKRIDREIDKMFSKINMGSDQLKGTEKIFKGKFIIAINDVTQKDVEDTSKEFEEKISNIVSISENNFFKKLNNSDFEIIALPAFESADYYESMRGLSGIIQIELKNVFDSGSDFLSTLKLLMAKLAISDFTPLDRQQIDERVQSLRSVLQYAIAFGQTSDDLPKKKEFDLKSLDDSSFSISLEKSVEVKTVGLLTLNDFELVIENNQMNNFVLQFLLIMEISSENFRGWREGLQSFVSESIIFRFERIETWLEENLKKWRSAQNPEFDDIIKVVMENLECTKITYSQTYTFCDEKCSQCFLKCTSILNHKGDHKCSTNHHCRALCDFCDGRENFCKMRFGHDGKHVCVEVSHVCCTPCKFKAVNNCTGQCQKMTEHEGEHECSVKRHPCVEVCSLDGCEGRCVINCDLEHTVHKCAKEQCMSSCCMPNCSNKCAALDHFHASDLSGLYAQEQLIQVESPFLLEDGVSRFDSAEHFCGKEHQCDQKCDQDGYCYKEAQKQIGNKKETFQGQRGTFTYDVEYVENGKKYQCPKKIKPFEKSHEGDHSCSKPDHFCTKICPTCKNICSKTVNHEKDGDVLHKVSHSYFISEQDIDVTAKNGDTRKYIVGEHAKAEICHVLCTALGRGHIHLVECDSVDPSACVYSAKNDGRRHQTSKYYPNPEMPKDEITHDAYWALVGFEDPCQKSESEQFQRCPAYCAAETHETNREQIFCDMPLWHEPVKTLADAGRADGIVTKDGHVFPCNHPFRIYHFVLCLNDCGSMSGGPWADLVTAVQTFVTQRLRTSTTDTISVVIYNSTARTAAEYEPISNFSQSWLKFNSGGTNFSAGLLLADNIIGRHCSKSVMPILIFMSGGGSGNGEIEMGNIAAKYRVSNGLQVYTLGFGSTNFAKLEELARLGCGQYLHAVSGRDLTPLFVDISAKHPPTIGVAL